VKKKGKHISIKPEADQTYFDSLTDRIMNRVEQEDSILNQNPLLKELPFKTPEGYFQRLGDRIIAETEEPKVVPMYAKQWFKFAAALAFVLVATLALLEPFSGPQEPDFYLSDISEEALIEYAAVEEGAIEELFKDEEVMQVVINDLMADIAYTYEDMIDFEKDEFFIENY
jgi:hypothetical protein